MNTEIEQQKWDPLIDLLRQEVQEYGGLFNLLQRQQEEIFQKEPDSVLQTNEEIEEYMSQMGALRAQREDMVQELARSCDCSVEDSLLEMLPRFPEFIRPLLKALVDEVNQMVERTRRKARQNFLLLSKTMELTHETVSSLMPEKYNRTYSRKGRVGVKGKPPARYNTFV